MWIGISMKKKMVQERIDTNAVYNLEGSISKAIEILNGYVEKYGDGIYLSIDYGCEGEAYLALCIDREETNEEYNSRINEEKKRKEEQEVRERNEYDRLAKKFGKEN